MKKIILLMTLVCVSLQAFAHEEKAATNFENMSLKEIYRVGYKIEGVVKVPGITIPKYETVVKINTPDKQCMLKMIEAASVDRVLKKGRGISFNLLSLLAEVDDDDRLLAKDRSVEYLDYHGNSRTTLRKLKAWCNQEKLELKVVPQSFEEYEEASLNNNSTKVI